MNFRSASVEKVKKNMKDTYYNKPEQNIEMKMMDTIVFDRRLENKHKFMPQRWIFTDLLGHFHYKDVRSLTLKDVIRAFFINLSVGKNKYEYNNQDLMNFMEHNRFDKIAYAIVK